MLVTRPDAVPKTWRISLIKFLLVTICIRISCVFEKKKVLFGVKTSMLSYYMKDSLLKGPCIKLILCTNQDGLHDYTLSGLHYL